MQQNCFESIAAKFRKGFGRSTFTAMPLTKYFNDNSYRFVFASFLNVFTLIMWGYWLPIKIKSLICFQASNKFVQPGEIINMKPS